MIILQCSMPKSKWRNWMTVDTWSMTLSKQRKGKKTLAYLSGDKDMSIVGVDSSSVSVQRSMIFPHDAFGVNQVDLKNDVRKVGDRREAVDVLDPIQVNILTRTPKAVWCIPVLYCGWGKWCTPCVENNGKYSRTESCCSA